MPFNDCASGSNEPNRVRQQNITSGLERDGFGSPICDPALITGLLSLPKEGQDPLPDLATAICKMLDEGG